MSTSKKRKGWLITAVIALVAVVAVVLVAIIGGRTGDDSDSSSHQEQSSLPPTGSTDESGPSEPSEGFNTPSTDYLGRKIETPRNSSGQPLGEARQDVSDVCSSAEKERVGDVSIQATEPVTLWSTEDGPSKIDHGSPVGYSHSPQGAALAAWNYYSLLQPNNDTSWWIVDNKMELSSEEKKEFDEQRGGEEWSENDPARKQIAPSAYRVSSCDDDYVVVDIAREVAFTNDGERLDPPEYFAERFGAVWDGDDWKLQIEPMRYSPGKIDDVDGWAEWNF